MIFNTKTLSWPSPTPTFPLGLWIIKIILSDYAKLLKGQSLRPSVLLWTYSNPQLSTYIMCDLGLAWGLEMVSSLSWKSFTTGFLLPTLSAIDVYGAESCSQSALVYWHCYSATKPQVVQAWHPRSPSALVCSCSWEPIASQHRLHQFILYFFYRERRINYMHYSELNLGWNTMQTFEKILYVTIQQDVEKSLANLVPFTA